MAGIKRSREGEQLRDPGDEAKRAQRGVGAQIYHREKPLSWLFQKECCSSITHSPKAASGDPEDGAGVGGSGWTAREGFIVELHGEIIQQMQLDAGQEPRCCGGSSLLPKIQPRSGDGVMGTIPISAAPPHLRRTKWLLIPTSLSASFSRVTNPSVIQTASMIPFLLLGG